MFGYIGNDSWDVVTVFLTPTERDVLEHQELRGFLIDPDVRFRKREIYPISLGVDEQMSKGTVNLEKEGDQYALFLSPAVYSNLTEQGRTEFFAGGGAVRIEVRADIAGHQIQF